MLSLFKEISAIVLALSILGMVHCLVIMKAETDARLTGKLVYFELKSVFDNYHDQYILSKFSESKSKLWESISYFFSSNRAFRIPSRLENIRFRKLNDSADIFSMSCFSVLPTLISSASLLKIFVL